VALEDRQAPLDPVYGDLRAREVRRPPTRTTASLSSTHGEGAPERASHILAGIEVARPSLRSYLRFAALQSHYTEGRAPGRFVDRLSDADVERLNELLPWRCFTVDAHGRAVGGVAWHGKRSAPQPIPDPRILRFHERFDLADQHVLEIGCFEGVHTIALCQLASRVTAIDARLENVVKTIVRCALYDVRPRTFVLDIEGSEDDELLRADLCHHVGVLYHLTDPVSHLRNLGMWISRGVMLDTHYALPEEATEEYEVGGEYFRYRRYGEHGRKDVFSGMQSHSKWLLLEDIDRVLSESGFNTMEIIQKREERNGPRALIFAERTSTWRGPR
jgi:2-polyprenyl-3-methyl-5-hydroxy-6-metoxy-1,4-benzoquinol methylase